MIMKLEKLFGLLPAVINPFSIFIAVTTDIIKNYAHIIYKTSAKDVGTEAAKIVPERPVLHGFNGKFSAHLGASGMVNNNGLNTHVERERVVDYS